MWALHCVLLSSVLCWTFAIQNKYTIIQEKVTVDYADENVVNVIGADTYKLNETTNGVNISLVLKTEIPDDAKGYVRACKWSNNNYSICLVQFGKTFKSGLEMEAFGLQALFVDYTRPPLIWPLKKGVIYHCLGWSPDSSKFPPNLPEGKWKVEITFKLGSKTTLALANWYVKLVYNK